MPGLTGLRAIAVIGVVLYQAGLSPWGGFLSIATVLVFGGLLITALLLAKWRKHGKIDLLDVVGVVALLGLPARYVPFFNYHPLVYGGGLALVAITTAIMIGAVTHPHLPVLRALLRLRPLRWAGLRSYGLYFRHWPLFMIRWPYVGGACRGRPRTTVRLAELLYRFVEMPIRHATFCKGRRRPRSAPELVLPVVTFAYPTRFRAQPQRHLRLIGIAVVVLLLSGACAAPSTSPTTAPGQNTPAPSSAASTVASGSPAASATTEPTAIPAAPSAMGTTTTAPTATGTATATAPSTRTPQPTPTAAPSVAAFDPELAAQLQRILDQTVADGSIPGAIVSVSIPGQEPWTGSSGVADRQQGTPMTPTTNVRIASISKIFTAVVVLQLVEEGKIELDAPLATYLPDVLDNGDTITVRNLLQHTSGLYDYLEDRSFVSRAYATPDRAWEPRELVNYALEFPSSFAPGAPDAWDYASTNYVILGMLVQEVTGNSLAQEMRQRIFEPLGLALTYFVPDEAVPGPYARGYAQATDQTNVSMSFAFATANIVSNPNDVRRFMEALTGGQLLQPATLEQMYTFVNGKGSYNMPELEYGLGLMRNRLPVDPAPNGAARDPEASRVIGHIGGFGGFRSATWASPTSGITIALGVNQAATDPNILATRVWDAILTEVGQ